MAIELSNVTFTKQDDVVPASGIEEIRNNGIVNTLAGNDTIIGTSISLNSSGYSNNGIHNIGTLNTSGGNDIITGIGQASNFGSGIVNFGIINTGNDNDQITGSGHSGLANYSTLTTGNGDDIISCTSNGTGASIFNQGDINSGDGNDIITGTSNNESVYGIYNGSSPPGEVSNSTLYTGSGDDTIIGTAAFGIMNYGTINTGNGADSIICDASSNDGSEYGFLNANIINTGNGNDLITEVSGHSILNLGIINTGNGDDSIIADGGFYTDPSYMDPSNPRYNFPGSVFLGNGKDYLKGFGIGNFNGGDGKDTLELTSGSYTVEILGLAVNFTKDSITMNTSEFEKLIAGSTTYNFSSLTNGQTISVA